MLLTPKQCNLAYLFHPLSPLAVPPPRGPTIAAVQICNSLSLTCTKHHSPPPSIDIREHRISQGYSGFADCLPASRTGHVLGRSLQKNCQRYSRLIYSVNCSRKRLPSAIGLIASSSWPKSISALLFHRSTFKQPQECAARGGFHTVAVQI